MSPSRGGRPDVVLDKLKLSLSQLKAKIGDFEAKKKRQENDLVNNSIETSESFPDVFFTF